MDLAPYTGEYLPLRRNYSTFEKLSMLVNSATVFAQGDELLLAGGNLSRWIPIAKDRFTAKYSDQTLVFERDADDKVSHMLINSPLGTYQHLTGLNSPTLLQKVLGLLLVIAVLAVVGYGYRGFRHAPADVRLPRGDVAVAWSHTLLLVGLYGYLIITLSGDVEEFGYGMPTSAHLVMLSMSFNVLLGLTVVGLSAAQWLKAQGGTFARLRYSVVALAALLNVWICWYFNILAYPFQ